jgi:drug/metabolite transporter (DMT)-like permease
LAAASAAMNAAASFAGIGRGAAGPRAGSTIAFFGARTRTAVASAAVIEPGGGADQGRSGVDLGQDVLGPCWLGDDRRRGGGNRGNCGAARAAQRLLTPRRVPLREFAIRSSLQPAGDSLAMWPLQESQRMAGMDARVYGTALVAMAAVLWSTAGLFVRLIDLDAWTILAWRSAFAALSLCLIVVVRQRRNALHAFHAIGWPGLVAIPIAVVSMGAYVIALKLTTVANVMIIYATVPFVAAGIAFLWIGERSGPRVLLASTIALAGIVILAGSATRRQDISGNAVAFLMTLAFGGQLVMARRNHRLDMAVVNSIAAALCAMLCWPLAASGLPTAYQLVVLALFGITTTSLAYLLFLIGGRYIPSGEAGLLGLIDVVLGPFWVWLAFGERPGGAAFVGGSLVLASVFWYLSGRLPAKGKRPVENGNGQPHGT